MNTTKPSPFAPLGTRIDEAAANAAADAPRAKPPGRKHIKTDKLARAGGSKNRAKAPSAKLPAAPLSADVPAYLQERERIIERGKSATISMAVALHEIDQYRKTNRLQGFPKSLAAYAEQRFGFTKGYTTMLRRTGEFMARCRKKFTVVNRLPQSERQIRSLLRLPEEEQIPIWEDAVKDRDADQVTEKLVTEKVHQRAVVLGLKWAKPGSTKAAPPATPPATTQPAPSAPVETKTTLQSPELFPAVPPVELAPLVATASTITKPEVLSLDDEIRAAFEHLHSLVAKHRKAVEVTCLLEKLRKNLELK